MKHILLTFDTDTLLGKVRNILMSQEYGYTHVLETAGKDMVVSLPVNVVAHSTKSAEQALGDAKAVCQMLGISLTKCVVLEVAEALTL